MAYFTAILARVLAIADGVLAVFTSDPVQINAQGGCSNLSIINVCLNDCGDALVSELTEMMFGGVSFLNGVLTALGAGCY
jgi:hypothetical protein